MLTRIAVLAFKIDYKISVIVLKSMECSNRIEC